MCFSSEVSITTFAIGLVFSVLLMNSGQKSVYSIENSVTGHFFIFIALIQLMDYLFWIDLNNEIGINRIMTIIGPILNVCQPVILYIIKYLHYGPDIFTMKNYNLPVAILNGLYLLYFIYIYIGFLTKGEKVTSVKGGHLNWPWIKYSNYYFYIVLLAINIFYLFPLRYAGILFIIKYFFLFISARYFKYVAGELWCFFGAFIPLLIYLIFG